MNTTYASRLFTRTSISGALFGFCRMIPAQNGSHPQNILVAKQPEIDTAEKLYHFVKSCTRTKGPKIGIMWKQGSIMVLQYIFEKICYRVRIDFKIRDEVTRVVTFVIIAKDNETVVRVSSKIPGFGTPTTFTRSEPKEASSPIRQKKGIPAVKYSDPNKTAPVLNGAVRDDLLQLLDKLGEITLKEAILSLLSR